MRHIRRFGLATLAILPLGSCGIVDNKSTACSAAMLRPIVPTHTFIPYPPISTRLNEQGTTSIELHITQAGNVDECRIVQTSRSDRLDRAACEYVKDHWHWQPTMEGCGPINTAVNVAWHLVDATEQNSEPTIPKSGLKIQRGVEKLCDYLSRSANKRCHGWGGE